MRGLSSTIYRRSPEVVLAVNQKRDIYVDKGFGSLHVGKHEACNPF